MAQQYDKKQNKRTERQHKINWHDLKFFQLSIYEKQLFSKFHSLALHDLVVIFDYESNNNFLL